MRSSYVLYRLGCVAILLGLLHAWSEQTGSAGWTRSSRAVAYIARWLILHGTPWSWDVAWHWPNSLGLGPTLSVCLCVFGPDLAVTAAARTKWTQWLHVTRQIC